MGDDLGGFLHLLHGLAQILEERRLFRDAELEMVDGIPDEQSDVVERVVQLVRDPGRQLADRRQLAGLHELLLLVPELLLTAFDLTRGLAQVAHDVEHGLATVL